VSSAHTLLRQRSTRGGQVLRLTVSACQCTRYSDTVPVLSDRVASCLVGRRLVISLDDPDRR
jgi:hypothetical protein